MDPTDLTRRLRWLLYRTGMRGTFGLKDSLTGGPTSLETLRIKKLREWYGELNDEDRRMVGLLVEEFADLGLYAISLALDGATSIGLSKGDHTELILSTSGGRQMIASNEPGKFFEWHQLVKAVQNADPGGDWVPPEVRQREQRQG